MAEATRAPEVVRYGVSEIEAIYRTAPIGLCVLDREMRLVRFNERFVALMGMAPGELIGRTIREVAPTLVDQLEPLFFRVVQTGAPILDIEVRGQTPARPGVERVWIDNWAPIKDRRGRVVAVNVSVQEVTELRRLEAEHRRSGRLHVCTAAVEKAREEDRVAIAHRLHDEVEMVLDACASALDAASSAVSAQAETANAKLREASGCLREAQAAARLIGERLHPVVLDRIGLCAAVEQHARQFGRTSGREIVVSTPAAEPKISSERAMALYRALEEALACMTGPGAATSRVSVTLRSEQERLTLVVHENGKALAADLDCSDNALGLLAVRERILALGGELGIADIPGDGTYLTASLAPADGAPGASAAP